MKSCFELDVLQSAPSRLSYVDFAVAMPAKVAIARLVDFVCFGFQCYCSKPKRDMLLADVDIEYRHIFHGDNEQTRANLIPILEASRCTKSHTAWHIYFRMSCKTN